MQRVPAASIAVLCATLAAGSPAAAADFFQQPQQPQSGAPTQTQQSGSPQTMDFQGSKIENAPAVSKMMCCFAVSLSAAAGLLVTTTDLTTAGCLWSMHDQPLTNSAGSVEGALLTCTYLLTGQERLVRPAGGQPVALL